MGAVPRIFGLGTRIDLNGFTFRGQSNRLVLLTGSTAPTDEFGVTELTRKWRCRRDLTESFLPQRGDIDFQYKTLRVVDWVTEDREAMTTITVRYNGFLSPRPVPVVIQNKSRTVKTGTLYRTKLDSGKKLRPGDLTFNDQCQIEYYAPTLTRSWAAQTEPKFEDPWDFKGFKDKVRIKTYKTRGVILGGSAKDVLPRIFAYSQRSVRSQSAVEPQGWVFRVTEVIEQEVVQELLWPDVFGR